MTDRINAFTVVLDHDIRDDDVEPLLTAIRMLRGVLSVTPHVADHTAHVVRERVNHEWINKLYNLIDGEVHQ